MLIVIINRRIFYMKKINEVMSCKFVAFRLTKAVWLQIKRTAREKGSSVSSYARVAVYNQLRKDGVNPDVKL
jgi:hypothetical protein